MTTATAPAPLSPRVRRLRDRCAATLAARRGLPVPDDAALLALGDSLDLASFLQAWQSRHTPVVQTTAVVPAPPPALPWWREPRRERLALTALSTLLAAIVGARALGRWPPSVEPAPAAAITPPGWAVVGDSAIAAASDRLLILSQTEARLNVPVSAADIASLAFASPHRRRWAIGTGLQASATNVLWLRGTMSDRRPFRIAVVVRRVRPGRGELRILEAVFDSAAARPERTARAVRMLGLPGADSSGRIAFELPRFVDAVETRSGGGVLRVVPPPQPVARAR